MPRMFALAFQGALVTAVVACGDAGLESGPDEQPESANLRATTNTFVASADARVESSNPSANYGSSPVLAAGTSPQVASYLRFDVSNLPGAVTSAKLRLFTSSATTDGPKVFKTSNAWSESTITWNNAPSAEGNGLADKGSMSAGRWVAYNVTPAITGNGTFSFVLAPTSSDRVDFVAREGDKKPQLYIITESESSTCGDAVCDTEETCSSCAQDCGNCNTSGHAYFDSLVARPDHWRSYSLRDDAQLALYSQQPRDIFYIWPNDPDPRKQDAAKLVIPSDGSGLKSETNRNSIHQVRVPFGEMELGHSYLVTWDAYYGDEWRQPISGIPAHKAFQFDGPDRMDGHAKIWWEVHHAYKNLAAYPVAQDEVARLAVRHYASSYNAETGIGVPAGPNVTSGSTSQTPVTPYQQWNIKPERWVRHWQLIEYGMDPVPWRTNPPGTLMSLWVADEDREPVQIYSRLQVTLWPPGIRKFWIEMNTSTNEVKVGRPDLVAYFRNIVILKDVPYAGVPNLLQRP